MDYFDGKAFCGHRLARDPQLRTTARNYDFKFNSSDHLEKIINRVRMDREVKERLGSKSGNRVPSESGRMRSSFLEQSVPPVSKIPQSGETSPRDTIVKVMSDAEIEAMISQAILSRPTSQQSERGSFGEISSRSVGPSLLNPTSSRRQIVPKFSKISEEVILCQQPQWVQIEPAERAFANAVDVGRSSDRNTCEAVLDGGAGESDVLDAETHSWLAKTSSDLVLRHYEAECGTPPDSPLSFGIESPLNECERAEMLRVLGHVVPDIPAAAESRDESLYSDSSDDEREDDDQEFVAEDRCENEIQPAEALEIPTGQQEEVRHGKRLHPVVSTAASNPNPGKPLNTYRSNSNQSSRRPQPTTLLDKRMKKQIETLEQDKIRIFSKMTTIQEKIIDVLDRLRISLVELSLPDGNTEVKLRERNAFEFSVRLSRNYLFPLGRMIEELRVSPKEDFQSATTNEACVKVCGIYGLLNQALQCYCKQLRHFFTDSVPKKLDILLNMVAQTTRLCLQKNIFDPRDTLIQHLLERCDLFMELVLEFSEQRKSAREGECAPKTSRREQHKLPRTSSKWELTMNLNTLNMYEPKLVPRVQKKKQPKKLTPTARQSSRSNEPRRATRKAAGRHDRDYGDCIAAPPEDPDDTQVRLTDANNSESVQIFNKVMEEQPDSELTRNLIEALQNITKDEVRQLLGPILSNFDSILRNSDNPESVESALVLLNSQLMAKYEQPRVDAENSPQTNDADQKDAIKRNSNYRREVRQGAKSKEHRCNQTTARKPERSMKHAANVKQGSTKATKQRGMSSGRPNTRNERHSLSNTSTAVQQADKNDAKKRSFRSCSVVSDKAAKKPTPAVTSSPLEAPASPPPPPPPLPPTSPIPPTPPTTLPVSAPLNEVIPPRSRTHTTGVSKHKMTSQRIENTTTSSGTTTTNNPPAEVGPNNKQKADKFAPERQSIEDEEGGRRSKEFRKQNAAEKSTSATTVADASGEEDQNTNTAGKNVGSALLVPGQVETLVYCSNVMYTFAKYSDDKPAHSPEPEVVLNVGGEDIPENEYFTDSCTRLKISTRSSRNPSFKSTFESTQNLIPPPEDEARVKEQVRKIIEERNNFIEQCKDDPLYTNPQFEKPWRVLSKISHNIANEIVERFENDLSLGEESYVRDFINLEMQT